MQMSAARSDRSSPRNPGGNEKVGYSRIAFTTGANAVRASADIGSRPECAHFPVEATGFSGSAGLLENELIMELLQKRHETNILGGHGGSRTILSDPSLDGLGGFMRR